MVYWEGTVGRTHRSGRYVQKCYGKEMVPAAQSVVAFVDNCRQAVSSATADSGGAGVGYS